jgi:HK97 family phage portal protein
MEKTTEKGLLRRIGGAFRGPQIAASGSPSFASASLMRTVAATPAPLPMVPSAGIARSATYRAIYLSNPWVFASVNLLSRSIGRLPLHVYEVDATGRKRRIRGGQLDSMLQHPGGGISRNAMYGGTMVDRLVYGNALWEIERDGGGPPTGVHRIGWRNVTRVFTDMSGLGIGYEVVPRFGFGFGDRRTLAAADVVHFGSGSDPEGPLGISPLEACQHTLALHDALVRHLIGYFGNSARPSGVFKVDKIDRDRTNEIRELLLELYTSPENAGKILMTTGEWQEIGHSPDHSSIVELVRLSREEIVAVYGVPPPVAGILEQAIKSNVKELREQFGRDSVGPHASDFEAELMAQLLPQSAAWANQYAEFTLAELLRPDLEARALVYQRMAGVFTVDEIRSAENYEPLGIAGVTDVPWAVGGAVPLPTAAAGRPTQSKGRQP